MKRCSRSGSCARTRGVERESELGEKRSTTIAPRMKQVTRGKGKSPATFNHHHFISHEAADRFLAFYSRKSLLPERGFELRGQVLEKLGDEIERRQWVEWAMQPIRAKIELVREFYANLQEAKMDQVWLLGRWVSFSAETINKVLGIPHEKRHELITGIREDEMADFLCPEGTEWKMKNGKFCHFPKKDMSIEAQAWLYFVCARLLPTSHYTEVIPERCRALYAILAGNPINVGKIIYKEILEVTDQKKSLPFPTLITLLSMEAGPEEGYDAVTYLDCLPPITDRTLARITVTRERQFPTVEERMEKKRPLQSLKEKVAKLEKKVDKYKKYNLAMWQLWAEANNIPEDRLPTYETSEEEESEEEASGSEME